MKPFSRAVLFIILVLAGIAIGLSQFRNNESPITSRSPATEVRPTPEVATAQNPGITPPQVVLFGTFVTSQIQLALISIDSEPQRWLGLKEYINANFYLDGIFKDRVLIRDTAGTTFLEIRITASVATEELAELPPIPAMPAHAWVESLPPVPGIDRVESNHYRIKRDLVMKELQSGEIFKQVKIVPNESGGFSIDRIRQGSMAEVIGLRVGDTIHKINDKPLTNITDVLELYKNLDSLEKVNVEINRMHEVQNLRYELN